MPAFTSARLSTCRFFGGAVEFPMSLEHSPARNQRGGCTSTKSSGRITIEQDVDTTAPKPRRIIRPKEAWQRLGIGHSVFYRDYVRTGRLRLIALSARAVGVPESDVEQIIDELIAARDHRVRHGNRRCAEISGRKR